MSDRWTTADYAAYKSAGCPEGWEPPKKCPEDIIVPMPTGKLLASFAVDIPIHRTERRVTTGRCKRTTVKRPDLGVTFASLTEERFFEHLRGLEGVTHIDIHPVFTLPGGIRYHGDFISWRTLPHGERAGSAWEVKGSEKHAKATAIRRMKRLFDAHHPLSPLRVVIADGNGWREIP